MTTPIHGGDDSCVKPADKLQEPPGLWGPDGLLAMAHVKMVLFLVCAIHVRWRAVLGKSGSMLLLGLQTVGLARATWEGVIVHSGRDIFLNRRAAL